MQAALEKALILRGLLVCDALVDQILGFITALESSEVHGVDFFFLHDLSGLVVGLYPWHLLQDPRIGQIVLRDGQVFCSLRVILDAYGLNVRLFSLALFETESTDTLSMAGLREKSYWLAFV